jgi:1-deoxy-D-xylulose-5-phosphate reductoisomerase
MQLAVTLLGATGSVGSAVLGIIAENPALFRVEAVVGGSNVEGLARIAIETGARFAALADAARHAELKTALSGTGIESGAGAQAVLDAASRPTGLCVAGISGTAGLAPIMAAIECGYTIALANKETLVTAGRLVMQRARETGARILPLDSEHDALMQALGGQPIADIAKMTITASGGPFRTWQAQEITNATPQQALAHPKWQMGAKISIDSASLMNKGLELIEAQHLFGLSYDQLDVVVHPQSIIHGLVHFKDGSVTAGMFVTDMRVPAAHCLGTALSPARRLCAPQRGLDLVQTGALTFEAPDRARFPCLALAEVAMREAGAMPAALNAANEIAVEAFLDGRLRFGGIPVLVEAVCTKLLGEGNAEPDTLGEALAVDHNARELARTLVAMGKVH